MDEINKELDPCPFCGSSAKLHRIADWVDRWYVSCSNSECGIEQAFTENSVDAAIEKWNTRSEYNGKEDN